MTKIIVRRVLRWLAISCVVGASIVCGLAFRGREEKSVAEGVQYVGRISESALRECSGVAMSPRHAGVFWTHNDSDNAPVLYAMRRNGSPIGKWPVAGARFTDWEDITFDGEGNLLLADIGDNKRWRKTVVVHRIEEPDPARSKYAVTIKQSWILTYPSGPRDAESIFVLGGHAYLVSKHLDRRPAEIYRFPLSTNSHAVLELVAEVNVRYPVASTALSADARTLAFISPMGLFAYRLEGDITCANSLRPTYQNRFLQLKREGCTFTPEGLLTTSEERGMHLFTNEMLRGESMFRNQEEPRSFPHGFTSTRK